MTAQQEPEHCHHECVCPKYRLHCAYGYPCTHNEEPMGTVVTDACEHDSRGPIQHTDRHQQCLNCCFVNSRRCAYHGYPREKIPVFCMYKIGTAAFEAQENLKGTPIEWQHLKEHDAAIAAKAREEVLNEMRDLVRNAKKYGTIEPEELFHWTGIIAMIDSLCSEVKKP